jgi:hypothetical protein
MRFLNDFGRISKKGNVLWNSKQQQEDTYKSGDKKENEHTHLKLFYQKNKTPPFHQTLFFGTRGQVPCPTFQGALKTVGKLWWDKEPVP